MQIGLDKKSLEFKINASEDTCSTGSSLTLSYENFSFLGSLPHPINKVIESRYNKFFIIIFFQIYNSYVQYKTHTEKIHSL